MGSQQPFLFPYTLHLIRGVASSSELGEQKGGLLWRAREHEPITGAWGTALAEIQGEEPPVEGAVHGMKLMAFYYRSTHFGLT